MGGEITYISDGGWDHNPRNSEVRFGLTLEHLENKRLYTNASVRAAGMSSYNEAERVNGVETSAVQKANLQGTVFLPEDESLPSNEALSVRRRRFQSVLTHALNGAVYAKQNITSLASHPGVEGSDLMMKCAKWLPQPWGCFQTFRCEQMVCKPPQFAVCQSRGASETPLW